MSSWRDDTILDGFECLELPLPLAAPAPGEPEEEGALVGTLVRRRGGRRHRRAMLYVHGWSDYFFQAYLAEVVDTACRSKPMVSTTSARCAWKK